MAKHMGVTIDCCIKRIAQALGKSTLPLGRQRLLSPRHFYERRREVWLSSGPKI
jgi:hypothetical protein